MATDVEIDDEELLRRVKAQLEQPVEADVRQSSIDYYHQNKDKVRFLTNSLIVYKIISKIVCRS